MTRLWTPWRSTYMNEQKNKNSCIFCDAAAGQDDKETLVVYRGAHIFGILNRYPYTTGHLMLAPYAHVSRLTQATDDAAREMMLTARRAERILESAYRPDGLNIGMNLGEAAGAGIEEHIHLHVLPRWKGDANFMTTVGETRVLPELLEDTFQKVRRGFLEG